MTMPCAIRSAIAGRNTSCHAYSAFDHDALVAVGSKDVIGGSGAALAELIPGAEFLDISDRDHMRAVGDARFKQGVLDFLTSRD